MRESDAPMTSAGEARCSREIESLRPGNRWPDSAKSRSLNLRIDRFTRAERATNIDTTIIRSIAKLSHAASRESTRRAWNPRHGQFQKLNHAQAKLKSGAKQASFDPLPAPPLRQMTGTAAENRCAIEARIRATVALPPCKVGTAIPAVEPWTPDVLCCGRRDGGFASAGRFWGRMPCSERYSSSL